MSIVYSECCYLLLVGVSLSLQQDVPHHRAELPALCVVQPLGALRAVLGYRFCMGVG